ncbi:ATP-binding protein [Streptomyces sp. NPDC059866]|uniref:ATP-binding protein n=1 Tax=Streptomyces sp. NPDC059866 TaxID=3346978 RepID=UPI003651ECA4
MCFTSTPRGARLARRLVAHRLADWGHPYDSDANETVTLVASELAANAIRHGHVPGRDFHLRLTATPYVLRVEVADTRGERVPEPVAPSPPASDAESGRGLLLVANLADRWGVTPREAAPGKCVWAEFDMQRCVTAGLREQFEVLRFSQAAVTVSVWTRL